MVDELRHLRTHDVLTGALNRFGIDNAIARALEAHPHEPMSLAFVDVDDFRALNDLYGRAVGDKALRLAIDNVRQAAPADAVIGRNGGDEVLLALFGDEAAAVPDILAQITGKLFTYELDGKSYVMSLSAGCAVCPNGDDLERAYTHADEALYAVKHSGTSGWMRWDPSLRKEMPPLTYRYA
jgi:diguanylate cyclase (GGDEF)-like protein